MIIRVEGSAERENTQTHIKTSAFGIWLELFNILEIFFYYNLVQSLKKTKQTEVSACCFEGH